MKISSMISLLGQTLYKNYIFLEIKEKQPINTKEIPDSSGSYIGHKQGIYCEKESLDIWKNKHQ